MIAAILARAYSHYVAPGRHPDPLAECAAIPRAELVATREILRPVERRCHVSRIHAAFLDRAIDNVADRGTA